VPSNGAEVLLCFEGSIMKIDKDIAETLVTLAVAMDDPLGKMDEVIARIEDSETRDLFKKAIGNLMSAIFAEIIFPIEQMYPDLNPDKG
jgi:hypothetical protein